MTATPPLVTFENFARVESERMFAAIVGNAGGTNVLGHFRAPTRIDQQSIIRMNRDTLYSAAILDVSEGASITIPESGGRYVSVMLVNQDHYINRVLHDAGTHELTAEELGSDFVLVGIRVLVDSENPEDVAAVNTLQDAFSLSSNRGADFAVAAYDADSFTKTRDALIELAKGLGGLERCFGRKEDVDPIRHLLGTASAWGGLPEQEASYINVNPALPVGEYSLTIGDVPVDGFWSISLYNAEGFFQENPSAAYSVNNITGTPNEDGTITVHFGGDGSAPNSLPIMEGWNYLVRLYRPRPEVLDGSWTFPAVSA